MDTRRPMVPATRRDQLGVTAEGMFDQRLGSAALGVASGRPWTAVATVTRDNRPARVAATDQVKAEAPMFVHGGRTRTQGLSLVGLFRSVVIL